MVTIVLLLLCWRSGGSVTVCQVLNMPPPLAWSLGWLSPDRVFQLRIQRPLGISTPSN